MRTQKDGGGLAARGSLAPPAEAAGRVLGRQGRQGSPSAAGPRQATCSGQPGPGQPRIARLSTATRAKNFCNKGKRKHVRCLGGRGQGIRVSGREKLHIFYTNKNGPDTGGIYWCRSESRGDRGAVTRPEAAFQKRGGSPWKARDGGGQCGRWKRSTAASTGTRGALS